MSTAAAAARIGVSRSARHTDLPLPTSRFPLPASSLHPPAFGGHPPDARVERQQYPRRAGDQPARLGHRRRARRAFADVRLHARTLLGVQCAVDPGVNASFVKMLHASLVHLLARHRAAAPRMLPPAAGAPAPASFQPTRTTARVRPRSRDNPILLRASAAPRGR